MRTNPYRIAVIGGGPAGLMAAEVLSASQPPCGCAITVFDRMPSIGRRLLMAGRGGLNLTNGEDLGRLLARYGESAVALTAAVEAMPPSAVRDWCEGLGQDTFVGSSGRVFPRAMKASPLLRAWLRRLGERGIEIRPRHHWKGWNRDGALAFAGPEEDVAIIADAVVLALGGASWPGLGADPSWVERLRGIGVKVAAMQPANCGLRIDWSEPFRQRFEGQPLKRIGVSLGDATVRGEALVTAQGIEGGAIYALTSHVRAAIASMGRVAVMIDLKPDTEHAALVTALDRPRSKQTLASHLRKGVRLSPVAIGLLQEATRAAGQRPGDLPVNALAGLIKALPLRVLGLAPIERAISSAGGVEFAEIDERFMLKRRAGVFVAGEMLDWEAPTGGYLLQAALATGAAAGRGVRDWLEQKSRS